MRLKNSVVRDFGGFQLDASAVDLHSANTQGILLPYYGPLPEQLSSASSAYIQANVQPIQGAKFTLVADLEDGKRVRGSLDVPNEEALKLLDDFFAQEKKSTGLTEYWLGFTHGNYYNWRKIATDFKCLLKVLSGLPVQERSWLTRRLE